MSVQEGRHGGLWDASSAALMQSLTGSRLD